MKTEWVRNEMEKEMRDERKRGCGEMEGSYRSLRNLKAFDNKDGLGARQHNTYKRSSITQEHVHKSKSASRVRPIH